MLSPTFSSVGSPTILPTYTAERAAFQAGQYQGQITDNPALLPVLSDTAILEDGSLLREELLNDNGYYLDQGPVLNSDGYLFVPGVYALGQGDDPSDVSRTSELTDPLANNVGSTHNDPTINAAIADYAANLTGDTFFRRDITDPDNLVYSPERDITTILQQRDQEQASRQPEENLPTGNIWYMDKEGNPVYSYFDLNRVNLSLLPDSVADAFLMGPEDIDSIFVITPDNQRIPLNTYNETDFQTVLDEPGYTFEVIWKPY